MEFTQLSSAFLFIIFANYMVTILSDWLFDFFYWHAEVQAGHNTIY